MASARKKVIVRRFSHGLLRGYLDSGEFVRQESTTALLQVLDLEGRIQDVPLNDVKWVAFVREFYLNDETNPERLPRKTFLARPRTEGLWVRLAMRDEDQIEGLAPLDLSLADDLVRDRGLQIIPPDIRGNAQRLYIPRSAMSSLQIVAVVTSPTRRKVLEGLTGSQDARSWLLDQPGQSDQPGLFSAAVSDAALPQ